MPLSQHSEFQQELSRTLYGAEGHYDHLEAPAGILSRLEGIVKLTGHDLRQAKRPCVYLVDRNGSKLYVGRSSFGLARVYTQNHHVLSNLEDSDVVEIEFLSSDEESIERERELYNQYKPILNKCLPASKLTNRLKSKRS